jgi:hypothetical protein
MTEPDWRRSLRGAVHRGDGVAVVALVRTGGMRDDALQLMGEGMLAAIIGHVEHAVEVGADCVNALRARGWYGDDDLAEQRAASLGIDSAGPVGGLEQGGAQAGVARLVGPPAWSVSPEAFRLGRVRRRTGRRPGW